MHSGLAHRGMLPDHSERSRCQSDGCGVEAIAQVADDADRHSDRDRAENDDVSPGQDPGVAFGVEQVMVPQAIIGHWFPGSQFRGRTFVPVRACAPKLAQVAAHSGVNEAPFGQPNLPAKVWGNLSDKCVDDDAAPIAARIAAASCRRSPPRPGRCPTPPFRPASTKPLQAKLNSASSGSDSGGIWRVVKGSATRLWPSFTVSKQHSGPALRIEFSQHDDAVALDPRFDRHGRVC